MSTIDIGIAEIANATPLGAGSNAFPTAAPMAAPAPETEDFFYIGSINIEALPPSSPAAA
jgi:hypothetical protein